MSEYSSPVPPEGYTSGLQPGPHPGEHQFVMPKLRAIEMPPLVSFGLDSLGRIVEAKDKLRRPDNTATARSLGFVASKQSIGRPASRIAPSELFDAALADMLGTIGDVSIGDDGAMQPAIGALNAAKAESSQEHKHRHRQAAGELLRLTG